MIYITHTTVTQQVNTKQSLIVNGREDMNRKHQLQILYISIYRGKNRVIRRQVNSATSFYSTYHLVAYHEVLIQK